MNLVAAHSLLLAYLGKVHLLVGRVDDARQHGEQAVGLARAHRNQGMKPGRSVCSRTSPSDRAAGRGPGRGLCTQGIDESRRAWVAPADGALPSGARSRPRAGHGPRSRGTACCRRQPALQRDGYAGVARPSTRTPSLTGGAPSTGSPRSGRRSALPPDGLPAPVPGALT